tara:strand:+ start:35723 stop:36313 length:591 start_codon:yes stop_codon:yes gene_type:complete
MAAESGILNNNNRTVSVKRKQLINIHLWLAAFFTPLVLMMAITGGLYLLGEKGSVETTVVAQLPGQALDLHKGQEKARIDALLQQAGVTDFRYAYVKDRGDEAMTRPTSRTYYILRETPSGLDVVRAEPSLLAAMIELHKGHGPVAFRWLEMALALGLTFIMISGFWLGLQSPMLKKKTLLLSGSGLIVCLLVASL